MPNFGDKPRAATTLEELNPMTRRNEGEHTGRLSDDGIELALDAMCASSEAKHGR